MPKEWAGRRIAVTAEYLNSRAVVYVDGKKAGEMLFPAGEVDLTSAVPPGSKHVLSMQVAALPLSDVVAVVQRQQRPGQGKGTVARRGLCGDVYLVGTPAGPRIADVKVDTSVRKGEITFDTALAGSGSERPIRPSRRDHRQGQQGRGVHEQAVQGGDLKDGRIAVTEKWKAEKLWDIHTPQNMYEVAVSLLEGGSKLLDAALPVRFGFREFWIDGRDFYLNGTRIFLSCIPLEQCPDRRPARPPTRPPRKACCGCRAPASTSSTPTTTAASRART